MFVQHVFDLPSASDRAHARSMVELRLEQASNDIPPILKRAADDTGSEVLS
jgi:hypothetical protein